MPDWWPRDPRNVPPVTLDCCGQPMIYREVFGVRIWSCALRDHPRIYAKDGQLVPEEDLVMHSQEEEERP